ncbi:MAG: succinate dehydrogenase, hydrophobic membrane anchor protein [Candidatus Zixiibacteriota bacterium]
MNEKTSKSSAYGWLLQRITGIFLAFFLILHFQVLHFTKEWRIDFSVVTRRMDSTGWVIFYLIFVPAGLFHAFNGAWQVIHDYRPRPGMQSAVKALLWILGIAISAWGYYLIITFTKGA